MLAKAQVIGRIGQDIVEKSDGFIPMSLGITRVVKQEKKTIWVDLLCFKYKAEYAKKLLSKGDLVYASGNLEINEHNGNKKPVILVEDIKLLKKKGDAPQSGGEQLQFGQAMDVPNVAESIPF